VVLDAGSSRPRRQELLAAVDHAVVSADFARSAFPELEPEQVLQTIHSLGPKSVVLTCGEQGGFWREDSQNGHYPAHQVQVVDTTGAGDAFHGAYLFGLRQGWSMPERCHFAALVAALVCRELGGRSAAPSYAEASLIDHQNEDFPKSASL
jgi:sulfofructose kinase